MAEIPETPARLQALSLEGLVAWYCGRLERKQSRGQADLAAALFISRPTLYRWLKNLGINWKLVIWQARAKALSANDSAALLSEGDRAMYARPPGGRAAWRDGAPRPRSEPR
jgi:hypothetical protein